MPEDDYSKASRCPSCRLTPGLCVCDSLPPIELPFRVILIQHVKELDKLSNTGPLAHRMLVNSEIHLFGAHRKRMGSDVLGDPAVNFVLLHPTPGARILTPEVLAPQPSALVVLDARWGQARRMSRRVPGIAGIPHVALPEHARPNYQIRNAPGPSRYSTVDAIAMAIRCAGHADAADTMDEALRRIRPRYFHVRSWSTRSTLGLGPNPASDGATPFDGAAQSG